MIMIAKFQRMHNRRTGKVIDIDRSYDERARGYPTMASNAPPMGSSTYSPQPQRSPYYQDQMGRPYGDGTYRPPQQRY
ncbi:hypothetical protein AB6A40_006955 [Gnathostoma spinigerum]|uniref:Uncharacterized protein n=1 Tax=Gnathostoma spinigerum TaxID=75299 RepID=A0ABD6ES14_9BILA